MSGKTGRDKRVELIHNLEKERSSRIICYVTGDRQSFGQGVPSLGSQIGSDVVRYFNDILEDLGKEENIDLFLYSRGGEINVIYPIVQLIRRHCKMFNVLIPYRAQSAATLLSLEADNIVIGEMGQLSPIDPTTTRIVCSIL